MTPELPPAKARLCVLDGREKGAELQLTDRGSYTIGRARGCSLRLREISVSREHACVECDGSYFWLVDSGSHNGTLVNGEPIGRYMLHDGDLIRIGVIELEFRLDEQEG